MVDNLVTFEVNYNGEILNPQVLIYIIEIESDDGKVEVF